MIKLNIHQAKTHLSAYLKNLKGDDKIVLCKYNNPFAQITLLPAKKQHKGKRRLGLYRDQFSVPDSFFEPLDDELLAYF